MDNGNGLGFTSARKNLIESYVKEGGAFVAMTKPYKSIASILFETVDAFPGAAVPMAHARAAKQQVRWFDFGTGQAVQDVTNLSFQAPNSWTNQGKASETNGGVDFCIEGISLSFRPPRFIYSVADAPLASSLDPYVRTMYDGIGATGASPTPVVAVDPAALASPPQVGSPFNLEQAFASAISPALAIKLQWNKEQTEYLGSADEIPEGGARSYLRANGQPRIDNRYKIPEGYMWYRSGRTDSQFNVIGDLTEGVVVPFNGIALFGASAPIVFPTRIAVDIICRVHGLSVRRPSTNA